MMRIIRRIYKEECRVEYENKQFNFHKGCIFRVHLIHPRRVNSTLCGHDSTIKGRTYSNVTSDKEKVTCSACIDHINELKYMNNKIDFRKGKRVVLNENNKKDS